MSHKNNTNEIKSLEKAFLASVTEIIESVVLIEVQRERFREIGCYLYRVSLAIMELQTAEQTPETIMILQSLFERTEKAKDIVSNCHKATDPISEDELESKLAQAESVIKCMGEGLSSIPSSAYGGQEYAEAAVRILSREMQNASFRSGQNEVLKSKELETQMISVEEQQKQEPPPIETDLYTVDPEFSMEDSHFLDMSNQDNVTKHVSMSFGASYSNLPELAQHIEPLYGSFFCPLTKEIMEEPVTIETGVTYEKRAIIEWFKKFENADEVCCPSTGKKLVSRVLSTNIALKTTIEEWKDRNEAARIRVARAALSLASSESMVLEALEDLQSICKRKVENKVQIRNNGMIELITKFLEYKDKLVRHAALQILQQLAEDDEGKKLIDKSMGIPKIIKLLSSSHRLIRHASLLLLLELSKSQTLCEKIGCVTGGILMLITVKYKSDDAYASETADQILRNLESSSNNIKRMADNGLLEPLLNHLIEGCEETKMDMGSYLGEIVCTQDSKLNVAQRASPMLIQMVQNGNTLTRKAAFKALLQISSSHPTCKILEEAGVIQIMVEEMFARQIYNEQMDSRREATAIVANILESGVGLKFIQVNNGRTLTSDYIVFNIIYMLKDSTSDDLSLSLIRILLCLTNSSMDAIVSVIKETEASCTLIELINNPLEELGIAAIKFLIKLSPYMGHTLVDRLCKINGQPENLASSGERTYITEKQAVSANFLAKLPHQNLTLNFALLNKNIVPTILQQITRVQNTGTRTSRYAIAYLEGLVGILVRFTSTLYEPQVLFLARNHNFTLVLTELLIKRSSDEVQRLSAMGLEKLSSQSIALSKPAQINRKNSTKSSFISKFLSRRSSIKKNNLVCAVHRGYCSSRDTFCLIDAKAVENLVTCLDHENVDVVEAALSAIFTLLDEKVDVNSSVSMLCAMDATKYVLKMVRQQRQESLRQKAFWLIEKILLVGGDKSASDIIQDRWLRSTLVGEFHHGDGSTRQMAERILGHMNQMPNCVNNYTF